MEDNMIIECKDLEWEFTKRGTGCIASGVLTVYTIYTREDGTVVWLHGFSPEFVVESIEEGQRDANDHNKERFRLTIDKWRKG